MPVNKKPRVSVVRIDCRFDIRIGVRAFGETCLPIRHQAGKNCYACITKTRTALLKKPMPLVFSLEVFSARQKDHVTILTDSPLFL